MNFTKPSVSPNTFGIDEKNLKFFARLFGEVHIFNFLGERAFSFKIALAGFFETPTEMEFVRVSMSWEWSMPVGLTVRNSQVISEL